MSQDILIPTSGQLFTRYIQIPLATFDIASSLLNIGCFAAGLAFTCFLQLRSGKLLNRCIGTNKI